MNNPALATVIIFCVLVVALAPAAVYRLEKRAATKEKREINMNLRRFYLWLLLAIGIVFVPMALLCYLLPDFPPAVGIGFIVGFLLFIAILMLPADAEEITDGNTEERAEATEPPRQARHAKQNGPRAENSAREP